jgi:SAM-dependent methyltransferase
LDPPATPPCAGPERQAALEQYRLRAATYDLELAVFEPLRRLAIARLGLQPGETVLDVGCGTGLSLAPLLQAVGAHGQVVGIEQSPEMIAQARQRLAKSGHRNVALLCAPAEEAPITRLADAALFHFTHDILRRPEALDHVLRHLKPGARVVACGLQWAPAWALPVNLFVCGAAWRSMSSWQGLAKPWELLAARVELLEVQPQWLGAVFLLRAACAARHPG